ncbi:MAG: Fe(2+)-trafficking protein [Phycisphaerales bacterium]|nr:Fe(2+)-trafficking protein [Phycisphaerales bacterium]
MDVNERIAQFEALVAEDPRNDMAHFSLGNAYAEANRHRDAATSFERCIAINMNLSRAYQLAAQQYLAMDDIANALPLMREGFDIAQRNGDLKVKSTIEDMFKSIGEEPPTDAVDPADLPAGTFICKRTGKPGTQLDRPPFKGPIGQWIYDNISSLTWNAWIAQGTKVINELRLDLSRDEDAETYDKHMEEYLGIDEGVKKGLGVG